MAGGERLTWIEAALVVGKFAAVIFLQPVDRSKHATIHYNYC